MTAHNAVALLLLCLCVAQSSAAEECRHKLLYARACRADSDCAVSVPGTSCGCTLDHVINRYMSPTAYLNHFWECGGTRFSPCHCPEVHPEPEPTFICRNNMCSWNYVDPDAPPPKDAQDADAEVAAAAAAAASSSSMHMSEGSTHWEHLQHHAPMLNVDARFAHVEAEPQQQQMNQMEQEQQQEEEQQQGQEAQAQQEEEHTQPPTPTRATSDGILGNDARCRPLRLLNADFEYISAPQIAPGWQHLDVLSGGDHPAMGIKTSGDSSGSLMAITVDGGNFLNGGSSSVFYQRFEGVAQLGQEFRATALVAPAGVAYARARIYFSRGSPGFAAAISTAPVLPILLTTQSMNSWMQLHAAAVITEADAGQPIFLNLESYRDAPSAAAAWDQVRAAVCA